jgi:type IV secretion system protein VirB9
MTNLRTYFFELHARTPMGTIDTDIPFYSKFRYSNASRKSGKSSGDGSIIQYVTTKGPDLSHPEKLNPYYTVSGDTPITPIAVFDDGKFTYFEFKEHGTMPAIFSVGTNGVESVVNFRIVNNYLAVEGIYPVFTLRNGAETVCVFNQTIKNIKSKTTKK